MKEAGRRAAFPEPSQQAQGPVQALQRRWARGGDYSEGSLECPAEESGLCQPTSSKKPLMEYYLDRKALSHTAGLLTQQERGQR